jgi:hypothetical protein
MKAISRSLNATALALTLAAGVPIPAPADTAKEQRVEELFKAKERAGEARDREAQAEAARDAAREARDDAAREFKEPSERLSDAESRADRAKEGVKQAEEGLRQQRPGSAQERLQRRTLEDARKELNDAERARADAERAARGPRRELEQKEETLQEAEEAARKATAERVQAEEEVERRIQEGARAAEEEGAAERGDGSADQGQLQNFLTAARANLDMAHAVAAGPGDPQECRDQALQLLAGAAALTDAVIQGGSQDPGASALVNDAQQLRDEIDGAVCVIQSKQCGSSAAGAPDADTVLLDPATLGPGAPPAPGPGPTPPSGSTPTGTPSGSPGPGPTPIGGAAGPSEAERAAYGRWEQAAGQRNDAAKAADGAYVERSKAEAAYTKARGDLEKATRDAGIAEQQRQRFYRPGRNDQAYQDAQAAAQSAETQRQQAEAAFRQAEAAYLKAQDAYNQADAALSAAEVAEQDRRRELEAARAAAGGGRGGTVAGGSQGAVSPAGPPGAGAPVADPGASGTDGLPPELARALADFNAAAMGVRAHIAPNGDIVLARGAQEVVIPDGLIRGLNEAQAAVNAAVADPNAVGDLAAFVDEKFRAGSDAALTAVVFALDAAAPRADLAAVRDQAAKHLATLAQIGSVTAQAALATINARADVLKSQDAVSGWKFGSRLEANAGTLVQQGWQGLVIMDYFTVLSYVAQLHNLTNSKRTAGEQEAIARQLVSLFDEAWALRSMFFTGVVRFGATVHLEPVEGGNVTVYYVVPPGQAEKPGEVSSTDPTGRLLIGRRDGEKIDLGGVRFRVKIVTSTSPSSPANKRALTDARSRLFAVRREIESVFQTIRGPESRLSYQLSTEERTQLDQDLKRQATVITQLDAVLEDKERRLAAAQAKLQGAQAALVRVQEMGVPRDPQMLADFNAAVQPLQLAIDAASAEVDKARAERDQAKQARDAAFTNYAILGVPVDGDSSFFDNPGVRPLYVHLNRLAGAGQSGGGLIEDARRQQIDTTWQQLVWWGTQASLTEKVAFFRVLTGAQQQIQNDPTLQTIFGANGLRSIVQIVVGAGDAAEAEKARQRLAGDVVLTVLAIPGVFFPPLGVGLAIVESGKIISEYREDAASAQQFEQAAQGGIATRASVGDRNRRPSVGYLVFVLALQALGGAADTVAIVGRAGGAAADASAAGSKVIAGADATKQAAGAADAGKAVAAGGPAAAPPSGAVAAAPPPGPTGPPTGTVGSPASPRGPPVAGSPGSQSAPTDIATGTTGTRIGDSQLPTQPPSPGGRPAGASDDTTPTVQGSPGDGSPVARVPGTAGDSSDPLQAAVDTYIDLKASKATAVELAAAGNDLLGIRLTIPSVTPGAAPIEVVTKQVLGAGSYGVTLRVENVATGEQLALKLSKTGTDEAFQGQLAGKKILEDVKVPGPAVRGIDTAGPTKKLLADLVGGDELAEAAEEFVAGTRTTPPPRTASYQPKGRRWNSAEQKAADGLIEHLEQNGVRAPDLKPDNVYFLVNPDGTIEARLLDEDLIDRFDATGRTAEYLEPFADAPGFLERTQGSMGLLQSVPSGDRTAALQDPGFFYAFQRERIGLIHVERDAAGITISGPSAGAVDPQVIQQFTGRPVTIGQTPIVAAPAASVSPAAPGLGTVTPASPTPGTPSGPGGTQRLPGFQPDPQPAFNLAPTEVVPILDVPASLGNYRRTYGMASIRERPGPPTGAGICPQTDENACWNAVLRSQLEALGVRSVPGEAQVNQLARNIGALNPDGTSQVQKYGAIVGQVDPTLNARVLPPGTPLSDVARLLDDPRNTVSISIDALDGSVRHRLLLQGYRDTPGGRVFTFGDPANGRFWDVAESELGRVLKKDRVFVITGPSGAASLARAGPAGPGASLGATRVALASPTPGSPGFQNAPTDLPTALPSSSGALSPPGDLGGVVDDVFANPPPGAGLDPLARANNQMFDLYRRNTVNPATPPPAVPVDEYVRGVRQVEGTFANIDTPRLGQRQAAGNDWYFIRRTGQRGEGVRHRVYVNPDPAHAGGVWRTVARIVDQNPDVPVAKIAGFDGVAERRDLIVVYTKTDEATEQVVDALRRYQAGNPGHFRAETPRLTQERLPGVSVGDEPDAALARNLVQDLAARTGAKVPEVLALPFFRGGFSFGTVRAAATFLALDDLRRLREAALRGGGKLHPQVERRYFENSLRYRLEQAGVDPANPARNLPPGTAPPGGTPPPGGAPGGAAVPAVPRDATAWRDGDDAVTEGVLAPVSWTPPGDGAPVRVVTATGPAERPAGPPRPGGGSTPAPVKPAPDGLGRSRPAPPVDFRVAIVPGSDRQLRIAVRLSPRSERLLEIAGPLPAEVQAMVVRTIVRRVPCGKRIPLPPDAGAELVFSLQIDDATAQDLANWLTEQGIGFRFEDETTLVIQGVPGGPARGRR